MQEGQRLLAILYIADAALMLAPGQRLACQNNVGRVVIHEKDLRQRFHRSGSPLLVVTTGRQRELKNGTTVILKPRHTHPPQCSVNASRAAMTRLRRIPA